MKRVTWLVTVGAAVGAFGCAGTAGPQGPDPEEQPASLTQPASPTASQADTSGLDSLITAAAGEVAEEIREMFAGELPEDAEPDTATWDIPITINDAVERWLEYFQTDGRGNFEVYLSRAGRYEPMMRAIFRDAGLPEDLVYLSLIESGYSPRAYSRAHAVGLWQFIASTGRLYDLKISYWVDERRDPLLATKAAAQHLKDLHDEFGSWYLAAAAYNGGPNRVRRSIRRSGSDDFWTLSRRRYLRRETRNYVPKLIAAALIAKRPEKYGFSRIERARPLAYDVVQVPEATSLDVIADAAGADAEQLVELNPQILRGVTPPGERYSVRVPPGRGHMFATNYARVPPSERVTWVQHVVRRGETLSEIGGVYGVSVSAIRAANRGVRPRRLRIGQRLVIPRAGKLPRYASSAPTRRRTARRQPSRPDGPYVTYRVQSGDSLWAIARRYAVSYRDLMRWNGLASSRIYPGDEVRIYLD